jgi:hypothetical protein
MPKFTIKANVTGKRTGAEKQATITRPAESEQVARDKFNRDMRFLGYAIDGDVKVERDDS